MTELFLNMLNRSISAGWLVLAVLLLRIVLKNSPKWTRVLLWGIVALRLLCPFSLESAFSLLPSAETISRDILTEPNFTIQTGIAPVDTTVNEYLESHYFEGVTVSANAGYRLLSALSVFWILGMLLLMGYTGFGYVRLHRQVATAVLLRENIYQSEAVTSPFILGVVCPKIYLPFWMEEKERSFVTAHEQAHIRRRDHWWKLVGFCLLAVYWFHPLLWLAYILLCRDIEQACDEKVIQTLEHSGRADYSQTLLSLSVTYSNSITCPLSFGEVGVKERVVSVLKYKKPAIWLSIVSVLICVIVAVCFLTNPASGSKGGIRDGEFEALLKNFTGNTVELDEIEFLTDLDVDRKAEILAEDESLRKELDEYGDFQAGYLIYNSRAEYIDYPVAENASFLFVDWNNEFQENTVAGYEYIDGYVRTSMERFLEYIRTAYPDPDRRPPFFIKVKDGKIIEIKERPMA